MLRSPSKTRVHRVAPSPPNSAQGSHSSTPSITTLKQISAIVARLDDSDANIRKAAVRALGRIEPRVLDEQADHLMAKFEPSGVYTPPAQTPPAQTPLAQTPKQTWDVRKAWRKAPVTRPRTERFPTSPPSAPATRLAWSRSSPDIESLRSATLTARGVAVRVASEEAIRNGAAWTMAQARRLKFLPNVPPTRLALHDEYYDDSLRELLDQAIVGVCSRIAEALNECAQVREGVSAAEHEFSTRLDDALRSFKDPNAERLLRQAIHAHTLRASKSCSRLCAAMKHLEDEAEMAQIVHIADMRSLAARLAAQREAIASSLRHELRDVETEGELCISRLLAENCRLKAEHAAELQRRDGHAAALEAALELEREAIVRREAELMLLGSEIGERDDITAGLEGKLRRARCESQAIVADLAVEETAREELERAADEAMATLRREDAARLRVLRRELEVVEELRHAELRRHRLQSANALARKLAEQAAMERALNEQIDRITAQSKEEEARRKTAEKRILSMESEVGARVKEQKQAATSFKQKLKLLEQSFEAQLAQQARKLASEREAEGRRYQGQIAQLTRQIEALKSSTSLKRSYLYWSGLQVAGGAEHVHAAVETIGLSNPSHWLSPAESLWHKGDGADGARGTGGGNVVGGSTSSIGGTSEKRM